MRTSKQKIRSYLLRSTIISGGIFAFEPALLENPALADDFVIGTHVTTQNGGNVLNGDDTLLISENGSITTTGDYLPGVVFSGNSNIFTNLGAVNTNGHYSDGVVFNGNNNSFIHSGTIGTTVHYSEGIFFTGDSNSYTGLGTISTQGDYSGALVIDGNSNTANNQNTISTSGEYSPAITITGDTNIIINSGSIDTQREYSEAFYIDGNSNTILNFAPLNTDSDYSIGIYFTGDSNGLTNLNDVVTEGYYSDGILVDGNNNELNTYGRVNTSATYSDAISITGNGNVLFQNGIVNTSDHHAEGIYISGDNNSATNNGAIFTTQISSEGVYISGNNNTFTNNGKVVSDQAEAFEFSGSNNTLNLNAPSFIKGAFLLGSNTTLNIKTGLSHSFHWSFNPTQLAGNVPNISGPVPVFQRITGGTLHEVATYEPTSLKVKHENLAQLSGSLSSLIHQRLDQDGLKNPQTLVTFEQAYAPKTKLNSDENNPAQRIDEAFNKATTNFEKTELPIAWLSVFGARNNFDATFSTPDYQLNQWGVAAGIDWAPGNGSKLGVMAGYNQGKAQSSTAFTQSHDHETSGFFAGAYGRVHKGSLFFDIALSGGISDHQQERMINNNLVASGWDQSESDYSSFWLSPELAIGLRQDLMNGWVATPNAKLRYVSQWTGSYSETGSSNSNASFANTQISLGEAAVEWATTKSNANHTTTLRAGFLHRASLDDTTKVTLIGQTQNLASHFEDQNLGYLAGSSAIHLSSNFDIQFGGKFEFGADQNGLLGDLKLVARF